MWHRICADPGQIIGLRALIVQSITIVANPGSCSLHKNVGWRVAAIPRYAKSDFR
jgi:hypothetical protein